jgi:hypothetical protein
VTYFFTHRKHWQLFATKGGSLELPFSITLHDHYRNAAIYVKRLSGHHPLAMCLLLWLVFASIVGSQNLPRFQGLARRGVQTSGIIYEGLGNLRLGNPPFNSVQVGETIAVWYDRSKPESSLLGEPGFMLHNEAVAVFMVAIIFPTFTLLGLIVKGVLPSPLLQTKKH